MGSDDSGIAGHRIAAVQVESGGKYKNSRGMTVIKDGIKASAGQAERPAKPEWLRMRVQSSPKFDEVLSLIHI